MATVGAGGQGTREQPGAAAPPWERAAPLVRAAQAGDAIALDDLLELLMPYVTRLCAAIAPAEAADASQEALIAVFRALGRLKDPTALYAWVRTITVREAVRVAAREARETPVADLGDRAGPDGPDPHDVHDVLRRLPPRHRAVLVLRELEGLDEQAAADLLGIPCGTVKSRLHRARTSFRKAWGR